MIQMCESDVNKIIHDLINMISDLKRIHSGEDVNLDLDVIHQCEVKLMNIRQEILESIEEGINEQAT